MKCSLSVLMAMLLAGNIYVALGDDKSVSNQADEVVQAVEEKAEVQAVEESEEEEADEQEGEDEEAEAQEEDEEDDNETPEQVLEGLDKDKDGKVTLVELKADMEEMWADLDEEDKK